MVSSLIDSKRSLHNNNNNQASKKSFISQDTKMQKKKIGGRQSETSKKIQLRICLHLNSTPHKVNHQWMITRRNGKIVGEKS